MSDVTFPAGFEDLSPWSDWVLHGEKARYEKRIGCTMEELQAFYDAVFPRLADACVYLEQYPLDELSDEGINLLWLMCSLITVSFPVECWRQPGIPDSGASQIDLVVAPVP